MDAENDSMYATGPIFSNISKGPEYIIANFEQQPNLIELLFSFTFRKTCSPTLKYRKTLFLSA
jgi:hypothetical protein